MLALMTSFVLDRNRNPQPNAEVAEALPFSERWFDKDLRDSSEPLILLDTVSL